MLFSVLTAGPANLKCRLPPFPKTLPGYRRRAAQRISTRAGYMAVVCPGKKDQTDFIIQKAVELGARRLQPVITRRTITDKVRRERFRAQGIEAAEQCRRLDVPEINEAQSLEKFCKTGIKAAVCFYG